MKKWKLYLRRSKIMEIVTLKKKKEKSKNQK